MDIKKTTCIVGIGNPLRSDDGVGAVVCQQLEEKKIPGLAVVITQQLDIGMTEDLSKFERVIFVDASLNEETISFQQLTSENNQPQSSSHHINAALLVNLTRQLFSTNTQFYMCAIGAHNFEMGNGLSETTISNANATVALLTEWIQAND
jgi:hydrogenase maturation protease